MRALLAATVVVALFAPPAEAKWRVERGKAVAAKAWDHHPCVERMRIRWSDPANVFADHVEGTGAWADPADCVVYFNSGRRLSWPEFCTRLLHEAGHLAGLEHSPDPTSLMYHLDLHAYGRVWKHGRWVEVGGDERCARHGRTYLGLDEHRRSRRAVVGWLWN